MKAWQGALAAAAVCFVVLVALIAGSVLGWNAHQFSNESAVRVQPASVPQSKVQIEEDPPRVLIHPSACTVHFHSGITQPADKVTDAGEFYVIEYNKREYSVRKGLVLKIEPVHNTQDASEESRPKTRSNIPAQE